ncbi:glycosyltransferase [Halobacteriovorax sp.]|uniref:glycosyltransferase n=1 Tax=Halobacteriovorax sp. TaxID=2020862 RepID=UPI003AF30B73
MHSENKKSTKSGKVLVLTSTFPRWKDDNVSHFVYDISTGLSREGWDVVVLAPHDKGAKTRENMGCIDVVRFRYLWPESLETIFYRGGAMVSLRKSRIQWFKLPIALVSQFLYTCHIISKERPDIIHAHWLVPQGVIATLLGKIWRIPVVVTIHGTDVFALNNPLVRYFKKLAIKLASNVTVNSSATMQATDRLVMGKAVKVPIGSNMNIFPYKDEPKDSRQKKSFKVLFVGRLIEEKGVIDLIHALPSFFDAVPEAECSIIGDGPLKTVIEREIEKLDLSNKVRCCGWLPPSKVYLALKEGDVFVGPSKTSADGGVEAQGIVFIEALLCGISVIASDSGGIVDIIKDGETGIVVKENSPSDIYNALMKIYQDPFFVRKINAQGYELAAKEFLLETSVKRFSNIFSKLL